MDVQRTQSAFMIALVFLTLNLVPAELIAEKQSLKFTEDLVIGKNSGDPNFIFSAISDVDLDKQENIYILDVKDYRIQKFDKKGTFLNSFTIKRGQGPEEVSFNPILAVTPDGEFAILDMMARKILIYNKSGKSLFSQILNGFPYAIDNKGRLYIAEADEFPVVVRYTIKK